MLYRYAALQDIHNLSNSIFDSFGNRKSDSVRKGGPDVAKSSNLFGSQHSATVSMPQSTAQASLFASSGSYTQGKNIGILKMMYIY